ncbi:MAG: hypoxanthine phosphoribosyltransferase [Planctomycetaceae bacterium]
MSQRVVPRISTEEIEQALAKLGAQITQDYADRPLTILAILTGSIVFVADLMRQIQLPHQLGLVHASSYRGTATSPGELKINTEFLPDVCGRDVLLIDDILDTGKTLAGITHLVAKSGPLSIRTAVLLWKKERAVVDVQPDYVCFEIPDEFVVGYGLDYDNNYRHLPYIAVIEETSP